MANKDFMGAKVPPRITEVLPPGLTTGDFSRMDRTGVVNGLTTGDFSRMDRGLPSGLTTGDFSRLDRSANSTYLHDTNNIVTSPNDAALNLQFEPNILDNYDTITYHWKLFIVPPAVTSSGNVMNLSTQSIIVESGVTDLTIDKVDLRFLTTPSVESGTGVLTNVKFEIVEPAGAGLIDKMFYQSVALGIGNWHVMPCYLQLEFRGRDAESSNAESGAPGSIGNLKWIWPLKIGDIKANVTNVGTRYDFTAILYNQVTQSNVNFSLKYNAVLNNLTTFSSAMAELEDKFNADQLLSLISNASIPDVYKIVVDPKIANYKITPANSNTNSVRSNDFVSFGDKTASFNVGTSIDKIIDSLLSNTDEYQKGVVGAMTPGGEGVPMNSEISQMKKFWRIITEARPLQFDKRRQNNANEFTIFVVEYDIGILDSNTSQTNAGPATREASRKRLATYAKKSILKKKYSYIFTGLNDQILNFDLNLNCAFGAAAARLGGVYSNSAMADKGVVNQNNSVEEAAVTKKLTDAISFQNNALTADSVEGRASVTEARNSIVGSELSPETKARYLKILEKSKPENRLIYLKEVGAAGGIDNDAELARVRSTSTNIARPVSDFVGTFVSDVDINGQLAKDTYQAFLDSTQGKLRPIAFYETVQDRAVGLGVESNSNSGIQKLSSMFSVALHSGLDASLQKIKMTIKGDPFWLFPQPVADNNHQMFNSLKPVNEALAHIKQGHFNITDSVNIYGSDNFIVIRFRTPRIFSIDSNVEDSTNAFNEVETFSGVYKVVVITSHFEAGKFTQELECILDPEIRLLDFMNEIEADASVPDFPASPEDLTFRKNVIPTSAIKTSKIAGAVTEQIQGVDSQVRNLAGVVSQTGSETVGNGITRLQSNIPTVVANIIPGLPNKLG